MIDEQTLMDTLQRTMGHLTGSAVSTGIQLGDRLGTYRAMAGKGPMEPDAVAAAVDADPRLVREWLAGQAAAGLLGHDADAGTFELSAESAMILADDTSPVFLARAVQTLTSLAVDLDHLEAAFRGSGAFAWGDHDHGQFDGVEWFFRTGYAANLTTTWLPALDGVVDVLDDGADVCDVGCGHGAALGVMAEAFPASRFVGVDNHAPSIRTATRRLEDAGVADRCRLELADAQAYDGSYDLITFFDSLHDLGDPVGAARHAREHLKPGGSVLLVEPFALDDVGTNIAENPVAALMYHCSAMMCAPNALSQGSTALGAQAGEQRLREVVEEAGYSSLVRRAETPFNLILQAHP